MNSKICSIMICAILTTLLITTQYVNAAQDVFYGVFSSYQGKRLMVMDKKGNTFTFSVTKDTKVMSPNGITELEHLSAGTSMSVTSRNGVAINIAIKRVPK